MKALSQTGKATCHVSPDGNSIIFQSVETQAQVYFPVSDWPELRAFIEATIDKLKDVRVKT